MSKRWYVWSGKKVLRTLFRTDLSYAMEYGEKVVVDRMKMYVTGNLILIVHEGDAFLIKRTEVGFTLDGIKCLLEAYFSKEEVEAVMNVLASLELIGDIR